MRRVGISRLGRLFEGFPAFSTACMNYALWLCGVLVGLASFVDGLYHMVRLHIGGFGFSAVVPRACLSRVLYSHSGLVVQDMVLVSEHMRGFRWQLGVPCYVSPVSRV